MSIEISFGMQRKVTETVCGGFTTNHPEDVVRDWIQSVEDWEDRDEIHSGYPETDDEGWKTLYVQQDETIYENEDEEEHIFDDEIQMWINQNKETKK